MLKKLKIEWYSQRLKNKDSKIREMAAFELGWLYDARAVKPLIRALGDSNGGVRKASAWALHRLGESQWCKWVKGDGGWDFVLLGRSGEPRAFEPLIRALEDRHYRVREAAASALGKLGDSRAVEPLIRALRDLNEDVRQYTALALGQLGNTHAVEPLITMLMDENKYVRATAANALGKLGDARAVEPLIRALEDGDENLRCATVCALGELANARAVEPLINALGDENDNARANAAEALGKLGDVRAVPSLIKTLDDLDKDVRKSAREALEKLGVRKENEEVEPDDTIATAHEERQFQEIDALLSFVEQTRLTQASVNRFDEAIEAADSMWEGRQHAVCKDLATLLATLRFYVHPEIRQPGAIAIVGKAPGGQAGNPVDVTTMIARASSCRVFRIWRVDDGGYIVKAAHEHLHAVDTDPPGVPSKETASIRLEWLEKRMDGGLIVAIPHGWERTPSTNFVVAPTNSRRISACGFDFLSPSANAQVFQGNAGVTREMIMGATRTLLRERLDRATSISEEWLDWPDSYALLSWFEYNRDNHRFRSAKIDRFFMRDHVIVTAELAGEVPDMDPFDREEVERFLKSFRMEYFD